MSEVRRSSSFEAFPRGGLVGTEGISALLWRTCQVMDLRILLGRDVPHEVIAWGRSTLWKEHLGINVALEHDGGTTIPLVRAPGDVVESPTLSLYRHPGRGGEVRA